MSNYAGFTITGGETFSFGRQLSNLGDVNGDGIDDVLIADSARDSVYVVYGSTDLSTDLAIDDIDGTNGFVLEGINGLGAHADGLGDINGDGFGDILVGGFSGYIFSDTGYSVENSVYVVYGAGTDAPASVDVTALDVTDGFQINGISGQLRDLENIGDVNGDGVNDFEITQTPRSDGIVIVASEVPDGGLTTAALPTDTPFSNFVLFGGANLAADGEDGDVTVNDLDGSNGFAVEDTSGGFFGEVGPRSDVTRLGDVNGDGFDDFLLEQAGAYYGDGYYGSDATTSIVFGTDTGFPEVLDTSASNVIAVDYSAVGQYNYNADIVGIGDVNGDGFDDLAVTDPGTSSVDDPDSGAAIDTGNGIVHIVYGSASGPVTTLSEAGVSDVTEGFSIIDTGDTSDFQQFGEVVAAAGDVNGDGIEDFLIANARADNGTPDAGGISNSGEVTLVFGNDAGFDRFIDVAALDSAALSDFGYLIQGFRDTGNLGDAMSAAGDLNGDGIVDFMISNATFPRIDDVGNGGDVYVLFGGEALLELADNADGTDDNIISLANLDTSVTGIVPTNVSILDDFLISQVEGDTGTTQITFTVRRDGDLTRDVSVDFDVTGAGFAQATADDFAGGALPSGTVTFASGSATADLIVEVQGDTLIESSEDFEVTLSNLVASGSAPATLVDDSAFGRIITDDLPPRLFVSGNSVFEDDTNLTFTFTRQGDVSEEAVVTFDISPFPAAGDFFAADSDDLGITLPSFDNEVIFAPGESSVTFLVPVVEDAIIEPRERIELRITSVESDIVYEVSRPTAIGTIINDDGRPPIIPPGVEADVFGDPHIVTLDGLAYDFMAVGEYVLLESTTSAPDTFSVQTRFEPVEGSDLLSITTRAAVETSAGVIEIDATSANPLTIDGTPVVLALGEALDIDSDGTDDIWNDGGDYQIRLGPNAEEYVKIGIADGFLNVCVFLQTAADGGSAGSVQGLMGNANGVLGDDFALRDGTTIPTTEIATNADGVPSLSFDFLYGRGDFDGAGYAGSWAIDPSERNFSDPEPILPVGFPAAAVSLDDIPALVRAEAEQAAREAGLDPDVDGAAVFEAAVLDFALTGDDSFLEAATQIAAVPKEDTDPFDAPALATTYSILQDESTVVEGDSGSKLVNFLVYRAGDDSTSDVVDFTIGGAVDADDLASDQPLTGSVSFAPGETVQGISIELLGDLTNEGDEALTITISPRSGADVATDQATTIILTDDFTPEVEVEIEDQTGTEDTPFTFDLSEIFSDADGDDLTITAMTDGGVGGLVSVDENDLLTFDPALNDNGEVTITVTAEDGNGGSAETSFGLDIAAVNDAPVLTGDAMFDMEEDVPFDLDLATIFTDVEDDDLTFSAVLASGRTADVSVDVLDGVLTVTPGANVFGAALIDVTVDDGNPGGMITEQLTFDIAAVNDAPELANPIDDQTGTEDTPFTLDISDVFDDVDGDTLEITASTDGGVAGTASVASGQLTFAPAPDGNGIVVITLTAEDIAGETVSDTFELDIAAVNDAPVAEDDSGFTVDAGETLTIASADLLANDSDVDMDLLSIASVTSGSGGTAMLDSFGNVSFASDGTVGPASFTYTVSDGLLTDTATVSLTVLDDTTGEFNVITGDPDAKNVLRGSDVADLIIGGSVKDVIRGGLGDDSIEGGDGNNALRGEGGDDTITGGAHRDRMFGGDGNDLMMGLGGNDRLDGGADNDTLIGGEERDRLFGGEGADQLIGEGGNDVLGLSDLTSRIGDGSADEIIFGNDDGRDKVYGFESGLDMVSLSDSDSYELRYSGNNTILEFGSTTAIFYDATVLATDIDYL